MSQEIDVNFSLVEIISHRLLIRAASFRDISVVPVEERSAYAYVTEKAI